MLKKLIFLTLSLMVLTFTACNNKNKTTANASDESCETKTCASACGGCTSTKNVGMELENPGELMVMYFHATRRCATCEAVEKETSLALGEAFGDDVTFMSFNREEEQNKAMVQKFDISGQTLLLIKGDSVVNFTNTAFLLARKDPAKYKEKFTETAKALKAL